jgi:hypothetical protein
MRIRFVQFWQNHLISGPRFLQKGHTFAQVIQHKVRLTQRSCKAHNKKATFRAGQYRRSVQGDFQDKGQAEKDEIDVDVFIKSRWEREHAVKDKYHIDGNWKVKKRVHTRVDIEDNETAKHGATVD